MRTRFKWTIKIILFMTLLLCVPLRSYAYFGTNDDYILSTEKPQKGAKWNSLEFVSEETYTVQAGDTLWGIAKSLVGDGAYYEQILSDNSDVVSIPELLMPGTELKLKKTLYTSVGLGDYINEDVFKNELLTRAEAFKMDDFVPPYRIFVSVPYVNDLQDADPYMHWEEFQEEVSACSQRICGDLVSDLTFERYQVTNVGYLCNYSFTFHAVDTDYIVIACLCYNSTTKSEAFALCEKDYCGKRELEEAKGKAFYAAVRYLDPGVYYVKTQEYIGAEDWNYSQLRNPFTDAMQNLYTGPLEQAENYPDDVIIKWKEPALEELVREELAALWQLAPEEKKAFMERDMTAGDLSKIEKLRISYYPDETETEEYLSVQLNGCQGNGWLGAVMSAERLEGTGLLATLEDLGNFHELKHLKITLHNSDITDLSYIGELEKLRELELDIYSEEKRIESIDFIGNLANLRTLYLSGWDWDKTTRFFEDVTDLSVLSKCPHLAYLTLITENVDNYDFLKDLPEIYYFRLDSERVGKKAQPDESLLPNACFIRFYGKDVRFKHGRGYEY